MGEFFHTWRRKAGCVTLVVALAFSGLWIRGFSRRDQIVARSDRAIHIFESFDGRFGWKQFSPPRFSGPLVYQLNYPADERIGWPIEIRSQSIDGSTFEGDRDIWTGFRCTTKWKQEWGRFIAGRVEYDFPSNFPVQQIEMHFVPSWLVTFPLTFLSAYLILWKPRKREPARPTQS